ncbi:MAG: hypothetical protein HGA19_09060 [Oscillochloris sp.]|nr:hypothetical protein [Oscillochloris sp.]
MARWFSYPLLRFATALVAFTLLVVTLPATFAQSDSRYFSETGHTLRGAFRYFWETNGGVDIFGYPITEELTDANGRTIQWFERSRFELTTVNGQYQVSLGTLGVELVGDRIFPKVPPIENSAARRYIPETQHIIQYGFKEVWEAHGDVRIFGYPLSEEVDEVLDDGEWHTVQYFERARFEFWPSQPEGKRVLFSNLGRKLVPADRTGPASPETNPQSTPTPVTAPAPVTTLPASINAVVTPDSGPPGTTFSLSASGFDPGERVGVWLTAPNQATFGADFQASADDAGSIAGANIAIATDSDYPTGIWSFNAQGVASGKQAIGYFMITTTASVGDASKLGVAIHDRLPRQGDSFILPVAAPPGVFFDMLGGGFTEGEEVSAWITYPDSSSTPIESSLVEVSGGMAEVALYTAGFPQGVYNAVIQGKSSQVIASASFALTNDYVAGPGTARPTSVNGGSTPPEGGPGTIFQLRGSGFQPNEELQVWTTDPTGIYILMPYPFYADGSGQIGYDPVLDMTAPADVVPGVYGIHFRSVANPAKRVDMYFTATNNAKATPGNGKWLANELGGPLFAKGAAGIISLLQSR